MEKLLATRKKAVAKRGPHFSTKGEDEIQGTVSELRNIHYELKEAYEQTKCWQDQADSLAKDSEHYLVHKARESRENYRSSLLLLIEKV